MSRFAILVAASFALAWVLAACVPELSIVERPCPCTTGFQCCDGVCIADDAVCTIGDGDGDGERDAGTEEPTDGGTSPEGPADAGPDAGGIGGDGDGDTTGDGDGDGDTTGDGDGDGNGDLTVEAHPGRAWADADIVLSWDAPEGVTLASCVVLDDSGAARAVIDQGEGWALLAPNGLEVLKVECVGDDSLVYDDTVSVLAAPATYDWSLFVQGALARGLGVDDTGVATLTVANQRLLVGQDAAVVGQATTLAPLSGFSTNRADRFFVFSDGAWAGAAEYPVVDSPELIPFGVAFDDSDALDGNVELLDEVGFASIESIAGSAPTDAIEGSLYLAGDTDILIEVGAHRVGGADYLPKKAANLLGGFDVWVARVDADGQARWAVNAGSADDDGVTMIRAFPDGGAVVVGWLGATSALFGSIFPEVPTFALAPWGFAAVIDGDGNFTRVEGNSLVTQIDAVAVTGDGGFVTAGARINGGLQVARYGPSPGSVEWIHSATVGQQGSVPDGERPMVADAIAVDDEGRIWVAGTVYGPATFFAGDDKPAWEVEAYALNKPSAFLARYSSAGELEFARRLGSESSYKAYLVTGTDPAGRPSAWVGGAVKVPGPTEGLPATVFGLGSPNAVFADVTPLVQGAFIVKLSSDTSAIETPDLFSPVVGASSVTATWLSSHPGERAKVLRAEGRPPAYADDEGATLLCETASNNTCTSGTLNVGALSNTYLRVFEKVGPDRWVGSNVVRVMN